MYRFAPHRLILAAGASGLTAALSIATAGSALADQSVHAITSLATGYTDNVELVPSNPTDPSLVPSVQSDVFANVAPGMVFASDSLHITQVLTYVLNIRLYANQSTADSYSNSLMYQAVVPLSPVSSLDLDAGASHGRLNAFATAPALTQVQTQGRGDQAYAQANVAVGYTRALSASWQVRDSVSSSVFQPTDDTTTVRTRLTVEDSLQATKTFHYDALTASFRASFSSLDRGTDPVSNMDVPDEHTLILGPSLRWVRDLTQTLSADASVGVVGTYDTNDFSQQLFLPVGTAYLRYINDRYGAAVGYRHVVATNLLVGENESTNVVEVRGTVPVPLFDERVSASGAVGYSNGSSLDANQDLVGSTVAWIGDVSLGWRATDELSVGARYQLVRQTRDEPVLGVMNEKTRRQQFMIMLEGRYPSRQAAEIKRKNDGRADGGMDEEGEDEIDARRQDGRIGGK